MSTTKKKKHRRRQGRYEDQFVFRAPTDLRQFYEQLADEKHDGKLSDALRGALERDRAALTQEAAA